MAETYGFFEAMWSEEGMNPITNDFTGWWDTAYLWADFMAYFALFVGNGVFVSPTNQLKVVAGEGLSVLVKPGWAFINGHWYHNDFDKVLTVPMNNLPNQRIDCVKVRLEESTRTILALEFIDETTVTRGENTYDLKLAEIVVMPGVTTISDRYITDTRGDTEVCGFVKGLLDVVSTKDLFLQFEAIFNEWFDTVKDQVTGDLAIRLQQEFEQINKDFQEAKKEMEKFIEDDFVIPLNSYIFTDKVCIIPNEKVTDQTLIDVYFTKESIQEAMRCSIYVESEQGLIRLTAGRQPNMMLSAVIRVRVK